mmetsp:Transcript_22027/g.41490  ORF Transcript_22027/g.41490 Transcript_22027/m.41490 type:complete len:316 (-) Transcript_22027:143-1090(-)
MHRATWMDSNFIIPPTHVRRNARAQAPFQTDNCMQNPTSFLLWIFKSWSSVCEVVDAAIGRRPKLLPCAGHTRQGGPNWARWRSAPKRLFRLQVGEPLWGQEACRQAWRCLQHRVLLLCLQKDVVCIHKVTQDTKLISVPLSVLAQLVPNRVCCGLIRGHHDIVHAEVRWCKHVRRDDQVLQVSRMQVWNRSRQLKLKVLALRSFQAPSCAVEQGGGAVALADLLEEEAAEPGPRIRRLAAVDKIDPQVVACPIQAVQETCSSGISPLPHDLRRFCIAGKCPQRFAMAPSPLRSSQAQRSQRHCSAGESGRNRFS